MFELKYPSVLSIVLIVECRLARLLSQAVQSCLLGPDLANRTTEFTLHAGRYVVQEYFFSRLYCIFKTAS